MVSQHGITTPPPHDFRQQYPQGFNTALTLSGIEHHQRLLSMIYLKRRNKNRAQKQKRKHTKSQNQSSRNIHHKVTMHAKCLPVQRFGEEVSMLQVRPHMNDSKFPVRYALPKKVVANVYVLRVWRGGRIIGKCNAPTLSSKMVVHPTSRSGKIKLQM